MALKKCYMTTFSKDKQRENSKLNIIILSEIFSQREHIITDSAEERQTVSPATQRCGKGQIILPGLFIICSVIAVGVHTG